MSWATIRTGMQTRLATIDGLVASDVMPQESKEKNLAAVVPGNPLIEPEGHGGGLWVNLRVVIQCQRSTNEDMQHALDGYVWPTGDNSIIAAVYAEPTLDGACDGAEFKSVTGYGLADNGTMQAEVNFRCLVTD